MLHVTARGDFEHEGKPVHYELLSDGLRVVVRADYGGKIIEYERNQKLNFRDDFELNLKKAG